MITGYYYVDEIGQLIDKIPLRNVVILVDKNGVPYGYTEFPWVMGVYQRFVGDTMIARDTPLKPYYIAEGNRILMKVYFKYIFEKRSSNKEPFYYSQLAENLSNNLVFRWGYASGGENACFGWRKYNDGTYTYYPSKIGVENFALTFGGLNYFKIRQRSFHSNLKEKYDPGSNAIRLYTGYEALQSFGALLPDAIINYNWDNIYQLDVLDPTEVESYSSNDLGFHRVYFVDRNTTRFYGGSSYYYEYNENKSFYIRNGFPTILPRPGDKLDGETIETILLKQNHIELYTDYIPNYSRQQITGQTIDREKRIFPRGDYYLGSWFSNMPSDAILGKDDYGKTLNDSGSTYPAGSGINQFNFSLVSPAIIRDDTEMSITGIKVRVYNSPSYNWRIILNKYKYIAHGICVFDSETHIDVSGSNIATFTGLEPDYFYIIDITTLDDLPPDSTQVSFQYWVDPSCLEVA